MQTFEQIIRLLTEARRQAEEAKVKYMVILPDIEESITSIHIAGELGENASHLIASAMGGANPKEIEDAYNLIMACAITSASAVITAGGIVDQMRTCIAEMDAVSKSLQTYIGKIS